VETDAAAFKAVRRYGSAAVDSEVNSYSDADLPDRVKRMLR